MVRRRARTALVSVSALAAGLLVPLQAAGPAAQATPFSIHKFNQIQLRLVSGELINELGTPPASPAIVGGGGDNQGGGPDGAPETSPSGFAAPGALGRPTNFFPSGAGGCPGNIGTNVKVNQNCLNTTDADLQGRGQANNEPSIAEDLFRPNFLVASDNDYRRGDGTCGAAYSSDRGATWQDATVPNIFTRGTNFGGFARMYWEAGGDTSVAWDTKGNAYLSCQLFNRGNVATSNPDQSSGFVVFRSTGNNGASWDFPGRFVTSFFDPTGTAGVLEDKQLIAVDNHVGSPFQDRIYVSWTDFAADGSAYIYEAFSSDYGQTFSPRVLVSGTSTLCTNTFGAGTPNGTCNENQDSNPFVGPDGALYVAFNNFNNAVSGRDNRNQVLLAKSTDGGATFSAPVKVSDYYDLPDCDTYQGAGADPFRACLPEKGPLTRSVFRASNYPVGQVNPTNPDQVVVTFGSYVNADSNESNGCVPAGFAANGENLFRGVKTTGACNNKILLSVSTNGGASFSGTTTDPRAATLVTQAPGQRGTDQWWQWSTFVASGTLAVSYYDRQYGSDETSGYSDFSLSGSRDLLAFGQIRVTSGSMPPPTEFGGPKGGQFFGDYTGLTATGATAYPIWSDTRSSDVFVCPGTATGPGNPPQLCGATEANGLAANDEDIYTALTAIPVR